MKRTDAGIYYDDYFYTFSASTGAANFYISSRDNNIGVLVYQSITENGPWTNSNIIRNSGSDAAAITTPDIDANGLNILNGGRKIEHPGSLVGKGYYFFGTSIWYEDQLKLSWTHNPDGGRYYMIRVFKGRNHGGQGRSGTYGFKLNYPADLVATAYDYTNGWGTTSGYDMSNWNGFSMITGLGGFDVNFSPINFDYFNFNPTAPATTSSDPGAISAEQAFDIHVTGLRPDTDHKFFIEGLDKTANCKQVGRILGVGLQTDSNGVLDFVYYYYPTIESVDVTTEAAAATEMVAATKSVRIVNTDNTSQSQSVIQLKNYIKKVFTAPPQPAVYQPVGSGTVNITSQGNLQAIVERIDNGPGGGGGGGREFLGQSNVNEV